MKVSLSASLPTSRTAFAFEGEGNAKVSLDVSAQELTKILAVLLEMRGQVLKVTFETDEV